MVAAQWWIQALTIQALTSDHPGPDIEGGGVLTKTTQWWIQTFR